MLMTTLKNRRSQVMLLACAFCLFCSLAGLAGAAEVSSVSLSKLAAPQPLAAETAANDAVKPAMPFEPNFFGSSATYPSAGTDYTLPNHKASSNLEGLDNRGPHGGYDTTTNKCGVCHTAHSTETAQSSAAAGSVTDNHLLREGVTGCEYCHLDGGVVAPQSNVTVYTANEGNTADLGDDNSGHAITGTAVKVPASSKGDMVLSCGSCHTVHGTIGGWKPTDFYGRAADNAASSLAIGYKLLRANPAGGLNTTPIKAENISSVATDTAAVNQFAFSAWCGTCHDKAYRATETVQKTRSANDTFVGSTEGTATHTETAMATGVTGDINGPHDSTMTGVGMGAAQCYTCHRGGLSAQVTPDATQAAKLEDLGYKPGTNSDDTKCSICHYGTADFASDPTVINQTSDWPHTSMNSVSLLGNWSVEQGADWSSNPLANATVNDVTTSTVTVTVANKNTVVCGRCHVITSTASGKNHYTISNHVLSHTYPSDPFTGDPLSGMFKTTETTGTLDSLYSPGYTE